jgi:transcriptional regulator with XRE-family HTH domain
MTTRLRAARERRGLSQEELARRCGIPRGTVHEIENARHVPGLDRAARLYHYLGLDLEDALADFEIVSRTREGVTSTVIAK